MLTIAAYPVTTAVHPRTRRAKRIGQEALGRQPRLIQVAQRHAVTTDIQLASHLIGDVVQHIVEHVNVSAGQCATDRYAARQAQITDFMGQHAHRGFARPVVVDEAAARFELAHALDQRRRARFTADNQRVFRQHVGSPRGLQQRGQMARDDFQHAHLMRGHVLGKAVRIEAQFFRQDMQQAPGTQRTEEHGKAQIRSNGRDQRHAAVRRRRHPFQHTAHITAQRTVADQYAFRLPGGTGGVNHVRR
ncbi:hypothetical protein D3C81_1039640 [compost metagenome]